MPPSWRLSVDPFYRKLALPVKEIRNDPPGDRSRMAILTTPPHLRTGTCCFTGRSLATG